MIIVAGAGGFEPPNAGIKSRCLRPLGYAPPFLTLPQFMPNRSGLQVSDLRCIVQKLLRTLDFYNMTV